MRIYVNESQASFPIESALYDRVVDIAPYIGGLAKPITDIKYQFQLNATHYIEQSNDFFEFNRVLTAGGLVLSAVLALSEKIFRLDHPNREDYIDVKSEDLLKKQDYLEFLAGDYFKNRIDKIVKIKKHKSINEIKSDFLRISKTIDEALLIDDYHKAVTAALLTKNSIVKALFNRLDAVERSNHGAVLFFVEDVGLNGYLHFNGTDRELDMLDKWLSSPELSLEVKDKKKVLKNKQHLLVWLNALRARVEGEFSYLTLMNYVDGFGDDKQKYKEHIQENINRISLGGDDLYKTRLSVIDYLNNLLNNRKNEPQKRFYEMTLAELEAHFNPQEKAYIMSLYN